RYGNTHHPRTWQRWQVRASLPIYRQLRPRKWPLADVRVAGLRDPRALMRFAVILSGTKDLLLRLLLLGVPLVTLGCGHKVDTSWHQEAGYRWRALDVGRGSHVGFTALRASKSGLTHRNDVEDEHAMANRNLLIGAGV